MIESFIEYMWYLLTTPLKKIKKSLNKWYIFCRVFGRRFDEAKEDILRARDEGMVATCSHELLPVHGADRRLTRYEGEHLENFRSRIAMHEEICVLGGLNEGVLLAVKTLGYTSPVLVRANELTGFLHFTLDGSRILESDTLENRWAEFYIIIVMDADEEHPISFDILRKTVREWKEVGAKDNYLFQYNLSIREINGMSFLHVLYRKYLYYFDYLKLDGKWVLDGSHILDAERNPYSTRIEYRYKSGYELHEAGLAAMAYEYACQVVESTILKAIYSFKAYYFDYLKTGGSCETDSQRAEYTTKQSYRYGVGYTREYKVIWHAQNNLIFLDGTWSLNGSKTIDAWQKTEVL